MKIIERKTKRQKENIQLDTKTKRHPDKETYL